MYVVIFRQLSWTRLDEDTLLFSCARPIAVAVLIWLTAGLTAVTALTSLTATLISTSGTRPLAVTTLAWLTVGC